MGLALFRRGGLPDRAGRRGMLWCGGALIVAAIGMMAIDRYEARSAEADGGGTPGIDYGLLEAELEARDPVKEAEAAFTRNDRRFWGIYGLGLSFPGVPREMVNDVYDSRVFRAMRYTSDAIESDAHGAYISAATGFATRYNQRLAALIVRR